MGSSDRFYGSDGSGLGHLAKGLHFYMADCEFVQTTARFIGGPM